MSNAPAPIDPSSQQSSSTAPHIVAYAVRDQRAVDRQHLHILAICHWVWGGLVAAFACLGILYIVMGVMAFNGTFNSMPPSTNPAVLQANQLAESIMAWAFIGMGSAFLVIGWSLALATIYSGFLLRRRRRRMFSIVVAGINCAFFPFGTTLGVFTLLVLLRESTRLDYAETAAAYKSGVSTST